jgi:diguanylate cyclase (GGDEF)-like protein
MAASWTKWAGIPQSGLVAFVGAAIVVVARFVKERKPIIAGFFWVLVSAFLALRTGGLGPGALGYLGTASLFVLISLIEASYAMAYYDELTGLPGRRAFNEALLILDGHFAIAIVDIDHFKNVNDTYGHDVGDQVLRMVAAKLGRVAGGGKAFRCGGEEFAILFAGKACRDVIQHLEELRAIVEITAFRTRGQERRAQPRLDTDRRRTASSGKRRRTSQLVLTPDSDGLQVTISIGLAEASVRTREAEHVIHEADEALYRAKRSGRNRLEIGAVRSARSSRKTKFRAAGL